MKLSSVYFERNVPIGDGHRVDELHTAGDPWQPHAGWQSLERLDDGSVVARKVDRDERVTCITLDGYAYTYVAESDSAAEARALPPKPVSSAESGAAVAQDGLSPGTVGSTPARLARKQWQRSKSGSKAEPTGPVASPGGEKEPA